jgi:hypothetical protein
MVKLKELVKTQEHLVQVETEDGTPLEFKVWSKALTGNLTSEIAKHCQAELAMLSKERKNDESDFVPRNLTALQLSMVLTKVDIEISNGKLLGTDYDSLMMLDNSVLTAIFNEVLTKSVMPSKKTSKNSANGTPQAEGAALSQVG